MLRGSIFNVINDEEEILSNVYGLRGKVDAIMELNVHCSDSINRIWTVPYEFKSGKSASFDHYVQASVYSLLVSDRYRMFFMFPLINYMYILEAATHGALLHYLPTGRMRFIPTVRRDVCGILQKRNQLIKALGNFTSLPPLVEDDHVCNHCSIKSYCRQYEALVRVIPC